MQRVSLLGFDDAQNVDLSNESSIVIDEPSCAYLNITGVDKMPWSKVTSASMNMHAWLECYDGNGHYFKKRILLNAQGQSSLSWPKKNFAVDFCEDEWIGNSTTDFTIGDWVTQNAFHFKAYYIDYNRGVGNFCYYLYRQMQNTLPTDQNRPWKRAGIENGGKALCNPEGFPAIVYLNGEFYGIYTWQIKKHHKNMAQSKDNPAHIHLDGTLREADIWGGTINWGNFEVRNPKTLFCVATEERSGMEYRKVEDNEKTEVIESGNYIESSTKPSDLSTEQIIKTYGENPPLYLLYTKNGNVFKLNILTGTTYARYNGDKPKELIDETMPYYDATNHDHVNTATVKKSIQMLSNYNNELMQLKEAGASVPEIRTAFEERFDVISLIDYYCLSLMVSHTDGFGKNWQWITYDGHKWYIAPYDLDATFGNQTCGYICQIADYTNAPGALPYTLPITNGPYYWIQNYYMDDYKARWQELREAGVFSAANINAIMRGWRSRIGEEMFEEEWAKWPQSYCINPVVTNPNWEWVGNTRKYETYPAYSETTTYNEGDKCSMNYINFIATGTTLGVQPWLSLGYVDSPERFEAWVERRLMLEDTYLTGTLEGMPDSCSLNITSAGMATICVPFAFDIPSGISLYSVTNVNDDGTEVELESVSVTTANTPYLAKGPIGTYLINGIKENLTIGKQLTDGLLTGTYITTYVPHNNFVLQNQNGSVGFYQIEEDNTVKVINNQAYLNSATIPTTLYAMCKSFLSIPGEAGNTDTSLPNHNAQDSPDTYTIYDMEGRQVSTLQHGVNIVKHSNGTTVKVIIK